MQVTVCGKRWTLRYTRLKKNHGDCDAPFRKNKEIRIAKNLHPKRELEVLIHELLHCADWSKDESWIAETAKDLAVILWKIGWRQQHGGESLDG